LEEQVTRLVRIPGEVLHVERLFCGGCEKQASRECVVRIEQ
jgi:hypothetical protein